MKNSKRTPRALKGAVLIMVMTVMFVLIFLLAGTIAVVYSAHNRAMVKYEESQAYYTARSVLDTYLDTFLKDNTNKTGPSNTAGSHEVKYYYIDDKVTPTTLKDVEAKQGRALELDIYGLKVSVAPKAAASGLNATDYPYDGSEGFWNSANNANDKYLYDWVKQYILDLALGDFSLNPGQTLEEFRDDYASNNNAAYQAARELAMTAINSEINDYKHTGGATDPLDIQVNTTFATYYKQFTVSETDDTLYYRIPAGTGGLKGFGESTTGGGFGKVADTFSDGATDAVIKVQLLERTLNLSKDGADFKFKFDGGNREKDHIKIQVTVEIMLDGVPTTTSVVYANEYVQKPSSNKAIVSLSDIKGADSVTAFGGAVSMATTGFGWTNNSGTSGNVYLRSDVPFGSTQPKVVLNKNNIFYTDKAIQVTSTSPVMTYVEAGATYFAQEVSVAPKGIGSAGHEVNIICENFRVGGYGDDPSNAKVFAEDFIVTGENSNGKAVVKGDVYCNYLVLSDNYLDIDCSGGNAVFKVNAKESGTPDVMTGSGTVQSGNASLEKFVVGGSYAGSTGKIHVATGIKYVDSAGNLVYTAEKAGNKIITPDNVERNTIIDWSNASFIDSGFSDEVRATNRVQDTDASGLPEDNEQDFLFDTSSKVRKFTMPAPLIGKTGSNANVVELDTLEKMYSDYFKSSAATGSTNYPGDTFAYYGDFNYGTYNAANHMKDFDSSDNNGTMSTNLSNFIDEHIVQPQDRNNKVDNTGLSIPSCFNALVAQSTSDAEILAAIPAGKNLAGIITSDCQIPSKAQMNINNVYNPIDNWVFVVDTRGGPVDLQMGNGSGGTFAGNFVVVGTNKCTVLMPASSPGTTFTLGDDHDFSLFDSRLGQKPSNLRLGNATNPSVPPAIDIVVSKNASKVTYGQHSAGPIQGYVYAPFTKFSVGGGNNGSGSTIHVDMFQDGSAVGNFAISVIGSIFCKGYDNAQKIGVAFIDPNAVTTPPGDKVFAWSDVYYQRGV